MNKIFVFLLFLLLIACNNDVPKKEKIQDTIIGNKAEYTFNKSREIFYSLPSPVETAMVLENTDVEYDDEFLLAVKYVDLYDKSDDQALNLGIYATDLSYITMFERQQQTIEYLTACKKLVVKLGLLNVIDDSVISKLNDDIIDRSAAMNIISEQFLNINAYFEENNREVSATLMILGSWVEGLYLSVNLIGDNVSNNSDLAQIIYDQQISLDDLISLMNVYKDEPEISKRTADFYELKLIYNKMETPMSQENFVELKSKVKRIRYSFTNQKL